MGRDKALKKLISSSNRWKVDQFSSFNKLQIKNYRWIIFYLLEDEGQFFLKLCPYPPIPSPTPPPRPRYVSKNPKNLCMNNLGMGRDKVSRKIKFCPPADGK